MSRNSRIILGLNSGTSADGVDAVACEITGSGLKMSVRVIGHVALDYPESLRRRILAIMAPAQTKTEELCRLHTAIGEMFAETAARAVKKLALRRIDLVGSHGQTVCHLPPAPSRTRRGTPTEVGTMQIGDAAIISERLRVPVVSQFRQADMAAGGQGAPLVPWTDYVLFADPKRNRVVQNIGGIANLTWLPSGGRIEQVIAFDTGPGNMLIDGLVSHFTRGKEHYDKNGRRAQQGKVHPQLLESLLTHPYLARTPPKSCGREQFGEAWMTSLLKQFKNLKLPPNDWIATATSFSALATALAYAMFLPGTSSRGNRTYPPMDEIILCGGGAKNPTLIRDLQNAVTFGGRLGDVKISTTDEYGISTQAKECVSFAMLAAACVDRVPANLPQVTGAKRRVVLGQRCDVGS